MELTDNRRWSLRAVALAITLLAGVSSADDVALDYAQVLSVRPVTESVNVPIRHRHCEPAPDLKPGSLPPGRGLRQLAEAIEAEAAQPTTAACAEVVENRFEDRTVGYRVRFRYGDEVYERTMREHPGERLRVRVTVRAQP